MEENAGVMPYVDVHTAKPEWRAWAEGVEMKEIVENWARYNSWRFVVTAVAATGSAMATCAWAGGVL